MTYSDEAKYTEYALTPNIITRLIDLGFTVEELIETHETSNCFWKKGTRKKYVLFKVTV